MADEHSDPELGQPLNGNSASEPMSLRVQVTVIMRLALIVSIALLFSQLFIFVLSGSQAVLASLADSVVDIGCQCIIYFAERQMKKQDPKFPIGKTRLETVGVILCSCLMTMASVLVIQSAGTQLFDGLARGERPTLELDAIAYYVLGVVLLVKGVLWLYAFALRKVSDSAAALAEDLLNDSMGCFVAIVTASIASHFDHKYWWVDPVGGLLISVYIVSAWLTLAKRQIDKIVGKGAPDDFLEYIQNICATHAGGTQVDALRAYHFGAKYMVELEILHPENMTVRESHDIALELQHKLEAIDEVERAFVHVDYLPRDEPEHKVERNLLKGNSSIFESDRADLLDMTYTTFVEEKAASRLESPHKNSKSNLEVQDDQVVVPAAPPLQQPPVTSRIAAVTTTVSVVTAETATAVTAATVSGAHATMHVQEHVEPSIETQTQISSSSSGSGSGSAKNSKSARTKTKRK